MSTTISYRAALVREIEQAMERIYLFPEGCFDEDRGYQNGQLDAYANILTIVKEPDL